VILEKLATGRSPLLSPCADTTMKFLTIPHQGKTIMNLRTGILTASIAALFAWAAPASAHCDTLDGPVVSAARKALDTGDIDLVLAWTQKSDDKEIRNAFDKARAVRKAGGQAKELADTYFFETLVRVHRAGESASYTGLKPAGEIEPPIAAADLAITTGKLEPVADMITQRTHSGLHQQFERVMATRSYDPKDVDAARVHVGAYVQYVHYVEGLYNAAGATAAEHAHAPADAHAHTD
jgi:hypothetical protein